MGIEAELLAIIGTGDVAVAAGMVEQLDVVLSHLADVHKEGGSDGPGGAGAMLAAAVASGKEAIVPFVWGRIKACSGAAAQDALEYGAASAARRKDPRMLRALVECALVPREASARTRGRAILAVARASGDATMLNTLKELHVHRGAPEECWQGLLNLGLSESRPELLTWAFKASGLEPSSIGPADQGELLAAAARANSRPCLDAIIHAARIVPLPTRSGRKPPSHDHPLVAAAMAAAATGCEGVLAHLHRTMNLPLSVTDREGRGLAHEAARRGQAGVVRWLAVNAGTGHVLVTDAHGRTPLHDASYMGHEEVVEVLLGLQPTAAFVGQVEQQSNRTCLHIAARRGNVGIVHRLANYPGPHVTTSDRSGCTPLLVALRHGQAGAARALVASGRADAKDVDSRGRSALHHAAKIGDPALLAALLRAGADPWGGPQATVPPVQVCGDAQCRALLQSYAQLTAEDRGALQSEGKRSALVEKAEKIALAAPASPMTGRVRTPPESDTDGGGATPRHANGNGRVAVDAASATSASAHDLAPRAEAAAGEQFSFDAPGGSDPKLPPTEDPARSTWPPPQPTAPPADGANNGGPAPQGAWRTGQTPGDAAAWQRGPEATPELEVSKRLEKVFDQAVRDVGMDAREVEREFDELVRRRTVDASPAASAPATPRKSRPSLTELASGAYEMDAAEDSDGVVMYESPSKSRNTEDSGHGAPTRDSKRWMANVALASADQSDADASMHDDRSQRPVQSLAAERGSDDEASPSARTLSGFDASDHRGASSRRAALRDSGRHAASAPESPAEDIRVSIGEVRGAAVVDFSRGLSPVLEGGNRARVDAGDEGAAAARSDEDESAEGPEVGADTADVRGDAAEAGAAEERTEEAAAGPDPSADLLVEAVAKAEAAESSPPELSETASPDASPAPADPAPAEPAGEPAEDAAAAEPAPLQAEGSPVAANGHDAGDAGDTGDVAETEVPAHEGSESRHASENGDVGASAIRPAKEASLNSGVLGAIVQAAIVSGAPETVAREREISFGSPELISEAASPSLTPPATPREAPGPLRHSVGRLSGSDASYAAAAGAPASSESPEIDEVPDPMSPPAASSPRKALDSAAEPERPEGSPPVLKTQAKSQLNPLYASPAAEVPDSPPAEAFHTPPGSAARTPYQPTTPVEAAVEALRVRIATVGEGLSSAVDAIIDVRTENEEISAQLSRLEHHERAFRQVLRNEVERIDAVAKDGEATAGALEAVRGDVNALRRTTEEMADGVSAAQAQTTALSSAVDEMRADYRRMREDTQGLRTELAALSKALTAANKGIEGTESNVAKISRDLSDRVRNVESRASAAVEAAARLGRDTRTAGQRTSDRMDELDRRVKTMKIAGKGGAVTGDAAVLAATASEAAQAAVKQVGDLSRDVALLRRKLSEGGASPGGGARTIGRGPTGSGVSLRDGPVAQELRAGQKELRETTEALEKQVEALQQRNARMQDVLRTLLATTAARGASGHGAQTPPAEPRTPPSVTRTPSWSAKLLAMLSGDGEEGEAEEAATRASVRSAVSPRDSRDHGDVGGGGPSAPATPEVALAKHRTERRLELTPRGSPAAPEAAPAQRQARLSTVQAAAAFVAAQVVVIGLTVALTLGYLQNIAAHV
ncbi:unnamed protein product [Pedinophyceae sp. YPF-701]|nr:unnamed protein product [Pedinophyceae sp. YPF-701]